MFSRRSILALLPIAVTAGALAAPAIAQQARKLRVGFQKGEPTLVAAKQNRSLETALAPLGVEVEWLEFPFGPPMLEAMRVGSIDFGGVGDTPPIFAQAAHADLLYVAALPAGASALLLPPGSKLQSLQDLKGKKLAFARGSSAHNLAVVAVGECPALC
jgi:sulfonate transport system substrate-binding protein